MTNKQSVQKFLASIFRCSRLAIALLVIGSFLLTPVHVLSETHLGSIVAGDYDHHDDHDMDHSEEDHAPHSASDHSLEALTVAKVKLQSITFICAYLAAQDFSFEPERTFVQFSSKTNIPPDESPPDSLQPRAPPAA